MALREFWDDAGREWRAWDVKRENIHPSTRGEKYMRDYLEGWIAFESMDHAVKCRLHPIPPNWESADREQLVKWLQLADSIRGDRSSGAHGRTASEVVAKSAAASPVAANAAAVSERPRGAARTFRYPSGRYWSVAEWTRAFGDATGEQREAAVLRFTSGLRSLDIAEWPSNWQTLADEQLATLLARGSPRPSNDPNPTTYRRRAADQH